MLDVLASPGQARTFLYSETSHYLSGKIRLSQLTWQIPNCVVEQYSALECWISKQ